nr:MAG TPA: hypothetical protein [Caudoviricetes sp.]
MRSSQLRSQRKWQIFFRPPQNPPFFCYNRFIKYGKERDSNV